MNEAEREKYIGKIEQLEEEIKELNWTIDRYKDGVSEALYYLRNI